MVPHQRSRCLISRVHCSWLHHPTTASDHFKPEVAFECSTSNFHSSAASHRSRTRRRWEDLKWQETSLHPLINATVSSCNHPKTPTISRKSPLSSGLQHGVLYPSVLAEEQIRYPHRQETHLIPPPDGTEECGRRRFRVSHPGVAAGTLSEGLWRSCLCPSYVCGQ